MAIGAAVLAIGLVPSMAWGLAFDAEPAPASPPPEAAAPEAAHHDTRPVIKGDPGIEPVSIPTRLSFRPTRIQDLLGTAWMPASAHTTDGAGTPIEPFVFQRSLAVLPPRRAMGVSLFDTDWLGGAFVLGDSGSLIGGDETLGMSYGAFRRAAERESAPFRVTRAVGLGDGAADRSGDLAPAEGDDRYGFAESGGEFDLYEISMSLPAASVGAFSVNWIGGLRAVRADVSRERVNEGSDGEPISTLDTARGTVAVPIVGTGVSWSLSKTVELIGHATTHTYSGENSLVDLTAAASIKLTPQMDLQAGYQDVRGRFDVRGIDAELDQSGLFARFRIRF